VTTVDAVNGAATLDREEISAKQTAVADRLLLTKTDLAAPDPCGWQGSDWQGSDRKVPGHQQGLSRHWVGAGLVDAFSAHRQVSSSDDGDRGWVTATSPPRRWLARWCQRMQAQQLRHRRAPP
jgi:G3E family GTPase